MSLRLEHKQIKQSFHGLCTLLGDSLLTIVIVDERDTKSSLKAFSPLKTEHC